MNKTPSLLTFAALLVFVLAIPVYALREPARMQIAQENLRTRIVDEGTNLYIENCAACHGLDGAGIGVMPALNHPALAEADYAYLFKTIARASHGSSMAAWHIEEGGILSDYQIDQLVSMIRYVDWVVIPERAAVAGFEAPSQPVGDLSLVYMELESGSDPHRCIACHEEPKVHLGRFGFNCARCHSSAAWTPALLIKHTFLLDHGGEGQVTCETCHTENYYEHTCYECHDHDPNEMESFHVDEGLPDYADCISCHPTGEKGEADRLRNSPQASPAQARSSQISATALLQAIATSSHVTDEH